MGLQGNPCNDNRDPAMRTGVPCNENRFFPVRIDLQGVPCKPYRDWVYSVAKADLALYKNLHFVLKKYIVARQFLVIIQSHFQECNIFAIKTIFFLGSAHHHHLPHGMFQGCSWLLSSCIT